MTGSRTASASRRTRAARRGAQRLPPPGGPPRSPEPAARREPLNSVHRVRLERQGVRPDGGLLRAELHALDVAELAEEVRPGASQTVDRSACARKERGEFRPPLRRSKQHRERKGRVPPRRRTPATIAAPRDDRVLGVARARRRAKQPGHAYGDRIDDADRRVRQVDAARISSTSASRAPRSERSSKLPPGRREPRCPGDRRRGAFPRARFLARPGAARWRAALRAADAAARRSASGSGSSARDPLGHIQSLLGASRRGQQRLQLSRRGKDVRLRCPDRFGSTCVSSAAIAPLYILEAVGANVRRLHLERAAQRLAPPLARRLPRGGWPADRTARAFGQVRQFGVLRLVVRRQDQHEAGLLEGVRQVAHLLVERRDFQMHANPLLVRSHSLEQDRGASARDRRRAPWPRSGRAATPPRALRTDPPAPRAPPTCGPRLDLGGVSSPVGDGGTVDVRGSGVCGDAARMRSSTAHTSGATLLEVPSAPRSRGSMASSAAAGSARSSSHSSATRSRARRASSPLSDGSFALRSDTSSRCRPCLS